MKPFGKTMNNENQVNNTAQRDVHHPIRYSMQSNYRSFQKITLEETQISHSRSHIAQSGQEKIMPRMANTKITMQEFKMLNMLTPR